MSASTREPAWAWFLVGVLVLRAGHDSRPLEMGPALEAEDRERWAPREDPRTMAVRDLRRMPGVGDRRAADAVKARWRHANSPEPLAWEEVRGIGPVTAGRIEGWLAEAGRSGALLAGGTPEE